MPVGANTMDNKEIFLKVFKNGSMVYRECFYKDRPKTITELKDQDIVTQNLIADKDGNKVQLAHIIAAIAHLRIVDADSLLAYLNARQRKVRELQIGSFSISNSSSSKKNLENILRNLRHNGLVQKTTFFPKVDEGKQLNLYSCTDRGTKIAAEILDSRLLADTSIPVRPLNTILANASVASIISFLYYNTNVERVTDGVSRFRNTGTVKYPGEMMTTASNGIKIRAAFQTSYLKHEKDKLSEKEYEEQVILKLNSIVSYVRYGNMNTTKWRAMAIVVCENLEDAKNIASLLLSNKDNTEILNDVYFTCEALFDELAIKHCFANAVLNDKNEVEFIISKPPIFTV